MTLTATTQSGRPPVERRQIVQWLRGQIVSGRWAPGERLPSRRWLAAERGVSPVTVDEALRRLETDGFLETRGTAGRFVAAYPPHLHRFALILPGDPGHGLQRSLFYDGLIGESRRITREDRAHQFQLYTDVSGHVDSEDYQRLARDLEGERLAGLVFAFPGATPYGARVIEADGLPQVLIATAPAGSLPAVYPDMMAWLDAALDHVRSQGARRVAMLQLPYLGGGSDWATALYDKCAVRNLQTAPWLIQSAEGHAGHDPRNVSHVVQLLFRLPRAERPDALLVADDHLAVGVAMGLETVALVPGRDLTVVAHCNWPGTPPVVEPSWVWLGFDCHCIMQTCLQRLDDLREGNEVVPMTWIPPQFGMPGKSLSEKGFAESARSTAPAGTSPVGSKTFPDRL